MAKRFTTYEEALSYVNTLPMKTIVEEFSRLLVETNIRTEPIRISESQFRNYFRIVGKTSDGDIERRGRKPKKD